ncbi:hypothetical protein HDV00_007556 [Rhizophlyctis rosea]|nr:hypothetical protein HDV00_007556 [Rhizophlyctis rosea]
MCAVLGPLTVQNDLFLFNVVLHRFFWVANLSLSFGFVTDISRAEQILDEFKGHKWPYFTSAYRRTISLEDAKEAVKSFKPITHKWWIKYKHLAGTDKFKVRALKKKLQSCYQVGPLISTLVIQDLTDLTTPTGRPIIPKAAIDAAARKGFKVVGTGSESGLKIVFTKRYQKRYADDLLFELYKDLEEVVEDLQYDRMNPIVMEHIMCKFHRTFNFAARCIKRGAELKQPWIFEEQFWTLMGISDEQYVKMTGRVREHADNVVEMDVDVIDGEGEEGGEEGDEEDDVDEEGYYDQE